MTSDDTPKQRAQAGLLELVDQALAAIRESISTKGKAPRGHATRSADAWRVLETVLGFQDGGQGGEDGAGKPKRIDPEAAVIELRKRLGGK